MNRREADSRRWGERESWIEENGKSWNSPIGNGEVEGKSVTFEARGDLDELEGLVEALNAIGLPALCQRAGQKSADFTVIVPAEHTAEILTRARTHNSGRKPKPINITDNSEIDNDTTVGEFLDWRKSHSAEECATALGLSRAGYFRRLRKIKEAAEDGKGDAKLRRIK